MEHPSRQELYQAFHEFIRREAQRERTTVNRRMWYVLLWCLIVPTGASALLLALVQLGALAESARGYVNWLFLLSPIGYSVYFLGSEVLREAPRAFRRGGVATTLAQFARETDWRLSVAERLQAAVPARSEDWHWLLTNYRMDLNNFQYRNRYLTALSGAVFFLIMQGLDTITAEPGGRVVVGQRIVTGLGQEAGYDPGSSSVLRCS